MYVSSLASPIVLWRYMTKFHFSVALIIDVTGLLQSLFFSRFPVSTGRVTVNQFCYNKVIPKWSLLSFLGSLQLELWGWWRLSGRQKRWCHVRSDFLGLHLKIICWRMILSHVLSKFRSVTSPEARRPYCTTATQKKTKLKKNSITSQLLYKTTTTCLGCNIALAQSRDQRTVPRTRVYSPM